MFKIEDNKILWEGRVVATFVDGLAATLRDDVESALECYETCAVSLDEHNAALDNMREEWRVETTMLEEECEELKNKLDKLAASN